MLVLFVLRSSLKEENVNSNSKRGLAERPGQFWSASLGCDIFCHEQKETFFSFMVCVAFVSLFWGWFLRFKKELAR